MTSIFIKRLTLAACILSPSLALGQAAVDPDQPDLHPTIAQSMLPQGDHNRYLIDEGPRSPTPRLADGTVDLSGNGTWSLPWVANFANAQDKPAPAPWKPWVQQMWYYNVANFSKYDPEGFCLPPGGPRAFATPYPMEIVQHRDRIFFIFEGGGHVWRIVYLDGRPLPAVGEVNPTYFGYSVGRWEGDTLVVDTVGYNEKTWLDYSGHMHTDQLRTREYFSRPYKEKLNYRVEIDDPGAFDAPWTAEWDIPWVEGGELQDYICQENNKFLIDLRDDYDLPFFETSEGL